MIMCNKGILIFLQVVLLLFNLCSADDSPQNLRHLSSFSFKDPFFPDAGSAAVPSWEVKGSSLVTTDFIHLTPAEPNKAGYITNRRPFFLKTTNITLEFSINSPKGMGVGGLAVWLKDSPFLPGNAFGASEKFTGVAIVAQTNPKGVAGALSTQDLSLHYNDGKLTFGIETKKGGCSFNFFNIKRATINILYTGDLITVSYLENAGWKTCVVADIVLPDRFFYSVSASTTNSDISNFHDVMSLQAYTFDSKKPTPEPIPQPVIPAGSQKDTPQPQQQQQHHEQQEQQQQQHHEQQQQHHEDQQNNQQKHHDERQQQQQHEQNEEQQRKDSPKSSGQQQQQNINEDEKIKAEKQRIEDEKKQMLIKSFPSEEFFESYAGDDDEDVMNFIEDMKEAYGHQLLELQFYFRDQISLLKSKFPSSITENSPISKDLQIVEEEIKLSASEIQKIKLHLNSMGLNSLDQRASGAIKNFEARVDRIQSSIKSLNSLLESVQKDQREMRQLEIPDNSGSNLPYILVAIFLVTIVGIVLYLLCKPKPQRRQTSLF